MEKFVERHNTVKTCITLIKTKYFDFKSNVVCSEMNLQKLINRSLHLYLTDLDFKNKIDAEIFNLFDINLKNISELVETEIPLYAYYKLISQGHEYNEIELYNSNIDKCISASHSYYQRNQWTLK
jgi:hypothetical protein